MSAVLLALLFHKNMMKADRDGPLRRDLRRFSLPVLSVPNLRSEARQQARMLLSQRCMSSSCRSSTGSSVKERPTGRNIAAAFLAVIGLALLSLQGDLSINYGDFLTLVCGLMFAVHMVFIDKFTECHDPIALTVIQILVAAIFNWICAPFLDGSFDFTVLMDKSRSGDCYTWQSSHHSGLSLYRRADRNI